MAEVEIDGSELQEISYTKNDVDGYLQKISSSWHKAINSILETGRYLLEAETQLDRTEFSALRRDLADRKIMSSSVVTKLLGIAKSNVLTNADYIDLLPPSYETLYLLSLQDEKVLEDKIVNQEITIETQQKDIKVLFPKTTLQNNVSSTKVDSDEVLIKGDLSSITDDARNLFIEALKGLKSEGVVVKGINLDD